MKGFGTVDRNFDAANFSVSAFRPACGPTAIRYWIEAAPRASSASRDSRSSQGCSGSRIKRPSCSRQRSTRDTMASSRRCISALEGAETSWKRRVSPSFA